MSSTGPRVGPFRNEVVRIADLTVNTNTLVGVEFSNCQIIGPAVLVPLGQTSIVGCAWPGPPIEIFWEIPPARVKVIGAVGLVDCSFASCRFVEVGLAGGRGLLEMLEANLSPEA